MRIGFFTDSYLPRADGIATSVEAYRAGLEALGHEVFVFCPSHPHVGIEQNNRIYRFPSIPSFVYDQYRNTFPFLPKHTRYIRSLHLDIIHTFSQAEIGIFGMCVSSQLHLPLISTYNADLALIKEYRRMIPASIVVVPAIMIAVRRIISYSELHSLWKHPVRERTWIEGFIKSAAALYFNRCDIVTVTSQKVLQDIQPYINRPLELLPLGTNLSLVPKTVDTQKIRTTYHLPQNRFLFISSSRLVKEKRIDFLIRAFALLPDEAKKNSALVIVGKGILMPALKQLVHKLHVDEYVIFTGVVRHEEVFEIVAASKVYVHAALHETQGLVLNEAAACGKPLIMVDKEVNPVLQEGINGYFADDTPEDFSKKMHQLFEDRTTCKSFGMKSKILAAKTSQEKVSKKLEALYQKLLDGTYTFTRIK